MSICPVPRLRMGLLAGAALIAVALPADGVAQTPTMQAPAEKTAETLIYKLETTCSLKGAEPVDCTVDAIDTGDATVYRHQIGSRSETIRISEEPIRMSRWMPAGKQWVSLEQAGARLSTNTICFNGLDLCVVNPNYLNSITEDNPTAMDGRDLVRVFFAEDGRINTTCYDEGCERIKK
ncbi:hypothetical protein KQ302_11540 [Synechococcus sp. CS-602]|uniref:hypothetical protein n=2 Tax=Synechococcales TaxID=1890424 RepID=UPI00223B1A39|nr:MULTISPECIES: hypothetical protein [Synechococcaceae]MCT0205723.1 hypothetical protein [Synechococcus sp. CS-602]MCT4367757.1 hypothetical protein [Candidatus Regnicoccus frigidus MAG-AL2]